jgi:hybrid cluster-associated redox disulfide protein
MEQTTAAAITERTTVDEVVSRYPRTARVFVSRRMHCVGCEVSRFETIADACRIYGQPAEPFVAELRAAAELP